MEIYFFVPLHTKLNPSEIVIYSFNGKVKIGLFLVSVKISIFLKLSIF